MDSESYGGASKTIGGHTSYDLLEPNAWVKKTVKDLTPSGGRVIDLGCGPGRHLGAIHELGMQVYGLDWSLACLKRSAQRHSFGLAFADMTELPFPDECFDTVLAWRSLYFQNVERIRHTVSEIKRSLKPGGVFICSCRSTTNTLYFVAREMGQEIEPGTFRLNDGVDFFDVCYHFFCLEEVMEVLDGFHVEMITEIPLKHTRYTAARPEYQNNFWVFVARK